MLDLYRMVSLVPENDAATFSGAISSAQMKALESEENEEEGTGANLSVLLLPFMRFLDVYHLKADIRVGSPSSIERQKRFAQKVLLLLLATLLISVLLTKTHQNLMYNTPIVFAEA